MVRRSGAVLLVLTLVVGVVGCNRDKTDKGKVATMPDRDIYYTETPTDPAPARSDSSSMLASRANTDPYAYEPAPYQPDSTQPRYHVVKKKETLYSLAQNYYGDQSKWKMIYEANRATIKDPNVIFEGQKLVIP